MKQALKRGNPGFDESYYRFSSFSKMVDDGESRLLLRLERDAKSGMVIHRSDIPKGLKRNFLLMPRAR